MRSLFLPSLLAISSTLHLTSAQHEGQHHHHYHHHQQLHQRQEAYRQPAPAYLIQPDPTAYQNWLPTNPDHGLFRNKNTSVTPWTPSSLLSSPEEAQPPHSTCEVSSPTPPQSTFWLSSLNHTGSSPFLINPSTYSIFRNIKDYGAVGDGIADDTDAFNRAISDDSRMAGGKGAGGSTGQPALIYIPGGTYLISSSVQMFIGTMIIGDPTDLPVLKASSQMRNQTVVLEGFDFGLQSTTNFYLGVRNLVIDTEYVDPAKTVYGLNWAVSQGTSLMNVLFRMPVGSSHVGVEMDGGSSGGGSGLLIGDLEFEGGAVGILFSNQQYAIARCTFRNVGTAVAIKHVFVMTLQGIECVDVGVCVDLGGMDVAGSVSLIDSSCEGCGVVVNGTSSILLENISVQSSGPTLQSNGKDQGIGDLTGKTYVSGHIYREAGVPITSNGSFLTYTDRGSLAGADGKYFSKKQPQYEDFPAEAFASVKDAGAKGDGITDDTSALQSALLANANCKITYIPHGIYLLTSTLYIPPGTRLVGEVWSTLTASGPYFKDESHPRPMLQIGKPGEIGLAEISDMLFTVSDVLPGAILVEVNMRGTAQGDVSFHNSHYRIGGAADSRVETACVNNDALEPCKAAFMLLHLGTTSSTYIENAWLWTADHDLDGSESQFIGTGRGMFVEAQVEGGGTWLVGTGSEHHALYAYEFWNARGVFANLMQVETPYWQPFPRAPLPWGTTTATTNSTNTTTTTDIWHDPEFGNCANVTGGAGEAQCYMSWALRILGEETSTIKLYGQGIWTFFNGMNYAGCSTLEDGLCQVNAVEISEGVSKGRGVELWGVNTKGVRNLVVVEGGSGGNGTMAAKGEGVVVGASQTESPGSWGGVVQGYLEFQ